MSDWTNPKLKDLTKLPRILAGPILRQVSPTSVTVWLALLQPQAVSQNVQVTLRIYEASGAGVPGTSIIDGQAAASRIGQHVYAVAVTARVKPGGTSLKPGTLYQYDLEFSPGGKLSDPTTNLLVYGGASLKGRLTYGDFELPTFCLPSPDWRQLHLLHGSCRKPHAEGLDGLLAIDNLLFNHPHLPERPQVMFHTGDQIYADDVSHTLLTMLRATGKILFFDEEQGISTQFDGIDSSNGPFRPGYRHEAVKTAHLTSGEDVCDSHLFFVPEFFAMYLFAWSDILWPDQQNWPSFTDVFPGEDEFVQGTDSRGNEFARLTPRGSKFVDQNSNLKTFVSSLSKVRRALANIPNYMICDDHEITDDWYITKGWCEEVLADKSFGRRVIRNGLLAYAVCQTWGNTPEQFDAGKPGDTLLKSIIPPWQGEDKPVIFTSLGIPPHDKICEGPPTFVVPQLNKEDNTNALQYYYRLDIGNYQILVLDTRNWRAFPESDWAPPSLLSERAFDLQITNTVPSNASGIELTLVITAAVPIAIPFIEDLQNDHSKKNVLGKDVEGWKGQEAAFESLIGHLAGRVAHGTGSVHKILILSGDVHHGFAIRMDYSVPSKVKTDIPKLQAVIAMFTSSALKNEDWMTRDAQRGGYHLVNKKPPLMYAGWAKTPHNPIGIYQTTFDNLISISEAKAPKKTPAVVQISGYVEQSLILNADANPDWLYRYEYIAQDIFSLKERVKVLPIDATGSTQKDYSAALGSHASYARSSKYRDIVGTNNLGEITFGTIEGQIAAIQRLWWTADIKKPFAISTPYYITLTFDPVNPPI